MSIKGFIVSLPGDILVLNMITQGKEGALQTYSCAFAGVVQLVCLRSLLFETCKKWALNQMAPLCFKKEATLKRCSIEQV